LIGRGPIRLGDVLAIGALTAVFIGAGFATHPSAAFASAGPADAAPSMTHAIAFLSNGKLLQQKTGAATVGDFLRERNVTVGPHDYVDPAPDIPLSDGLLVTYRAAVPVTIVSARQHISVVSAADDVGALLEEERIELGSGDVVHPALASAVPAGGIVRIVHVVSWERVRTRVLVPQTIHKLDFAMAPGTSRIAARGARGLARVEMRFTRYDDGPIHRSVVATRIVRKARPRIELDGVDEYEAFATLGARRSAFMAADALEMVATAYTADCAGCSGITASGRPAGHGIVAVDPSVIPLGTRLFIPGYGLAIAGDTGGAIHGDRIDLGFNSQRDAMLFGRREITVYRLK
jgi:3D (Asp-Asp-Asp) domain-containing protein